LRLHWGSWLARGAAPGLSSRPRALRAFAVAAGFSLTRISVPFWGLVGMLALAWGVAVALVKTAGQLYSSGGEASGNRSSSRPTE